VSPTDNRAAPAPTADKPAVAAVDVNAALCAILKRYDRIGFGRVALDAQPETRPSSRTVA
jgi:hypothetical protein